MSRHLRVLARLGRFRLDEERRRLGEAMRACERIEGERRVLLAEIAAERGLTDSILDPTFAAGAPFAAYAAAAMARLARIDVRLAAAEREVGVRRTALQACWREVRTVDLAIENEQRRAAAQALQRERLALDEIALQRHARDAATTETGGE